MSHQAPPTEARVVSVEDFDVGAHAAMQQETFGHLLEENGIPLARLGPEVFAWKLRPPAGPGRIAIVERGGRLVSSVSAYPLRLADGSSGWHLCDAATREDARGEGLFGAVMRAMRASIGEHEWAFAFPNGQSRGAFERGAFTAAVEVPLWFRPVIGKGRACEDVAPIDDFGADHDDFAARVAEGAPLSPWRSADYLRWRYRAHPFFTYQCLELRREGTLEGVLVLHRMEARGRVSLWVMELLATDRATERALARHARWLGAEQGCDVVLAMASRKVPGALRLPACFLPKKHVLMVRRGGLAEDPEPPPPWTVQTGDWDTF